MTSTVRKVIENPHPDIELGVARAPLEYFITLPTAGINAETGVVLAICGYGETPDDEYQAEKFRPYIADKYNCIAVGVKYFGITRSPVIDDASFIENIAEIYGVPTRHFLDEDNSMRYKTVDDLLPHLFDLLRNKNIKRLDLRCRPGVRLEKDYHSFGLLPAIDNLMVLGEVLKDYPVRKDKLIAFGSSYGGYIAMLVGKYAPHTLAVVIDNSGFSRVRMIDILGGEFRCEGRTLGNSNSGIIYGACYNGWTITDETAPNYFCDSFRVIRNLFVDEHRVPSQCRYYIFHSPQDIVAPVVDKDKTVEVLRRYNDVTYKRITPSDIDGRIFKNMDHAMNASLRGLFDIVAELDAQRLSKDGHLTDFDIESQNIFDCGEYKYRFCFDRNYNIEVVLEKQIEASVLSEMPGLEEFQDG